MLDWLSWTKSFEGDDGLKNYPEHGMFERGETVAAMHGYSKAWKLKCGGFVMVPTFANRRQRVLFMLGGKALRNMRKNGSTDESIIRYIFDTHYRPQFTRLDCAYDTDNETADPFDILRKWRAGEVKTHIRTIRTFSTERRDKTKPENTIYLGSVSSARQICIYNKAAEMGLLNEALTRVELRNRKAFAQQVADKGRTENLDAVGRQVMRDMMAVSIDWYNRLLEGETVDIDAVGRKETGGLMKWLVTQVSGGIQTAIDGDDDELVARVHNWANVVAAATHARLAGKAEPAELLIKNYLDLTDW